MKRKIISLAVITLILLSSCASQPRSSDVKQANASRVYEQSGNFSYYPPEGWQVSEFPGLKYKIILGPIEEQFTANVNFVDATFIGSSRDYVDANLTQLENFQGYKLLSREAFVTSSGIKGECVTFNTFQQNFNLKQICYLLPASDNKYYVISCSAVDTVFEKYLPLFEECAKTFEFIK